MRNSNLSPTLRLRKATLQLQRLIQDELGVFPTNTEQGCLQELCEAVQGQLEGLEILLMHIANTSIRDTYQALKPDMNQQVTTAILKNNSLAAVLDELSAQQRSFVHALAVFEGDWSVEVAAVICSEPEANTLCAELQRRRLVIQEKNSQRFRLVSRMRQYLLQQLDRAYLYTLELSYRQFYADLLQQAAPYLQQTPDQSWLERLDTESENIFAVFDATYGPRCVEMAVGMWRWGMNRGMHAEMQHFVTIAMAECQPLPEALEVEILQANGYLLVKMARCEEGLSFLLEALKVARERASTEQIAGILHHLTNAYRLQGDFENAHLCQAECYTLWSLVNNQWGQAVTLLDKGILHWLTDELDMARCVMRQSADILHGLGDERSLVRVLENMGGIAIRQKDWKHAEETHRKTVAIFRKLGEWNLVCTSLNNLAVACAYNDKKEQAAKYFQECLSLIKEKNLPSYFSEIFNNLAELSILKNRDKRAAIFYGASAYWAKKYRPLVIQKSELIVRQEFLVDLRKRMCDSQFERFTHKGEIMSLAKLIALASEV